MHSIIKQGYVAPVATRNAVSVATLGTALLSGEPLAGFHVSGE